MKLKSAVLASWLVVVALIGAGIPIGEELRADCAFPPSGDAYSISCMVIGQQGCSNECISETCEVPPFCSYAFYEWCTDMGCGSPACYTWGNCWAG